MIVLQAKIAGIRDRLGLRRQPDLGVLKKMEVMAAALPVSGADDPAGRFIDDYLRLERVALFLAGVEPALLFLGRSIGVSVASMRMIS